MPTPPPHSYVRAASLAFELAEQEFPFRRSVEIHAIDRPLPEVQQQMLLGRTSGQAPTDAALEELAGGRPSPTGGPAAWYQGSGAAGALAALSRYSAPDGAGLLLGFLMSSQVCVPLLDAAAGAWPTLKDALQMASAIALTPTPAGAAGQPVWSLVASRPGALFVVRTVEPGDPAESRADTLAQQLLSALDL